MGEAPPTIRHPPPPAGISYRGGPLLTSVNVETIFWGNGWLGAQSALVQQINQFFQFVLTSALMDQLAEYNVAGYTIGHGALGGTKTITSPAPGAVVSDAEIEQLVMQHLAESTKAPRHPPPPPPVNNTLYFAYVHPGVSVTMGGDTSCINFCGYHNDSSGTTFYAVVPFPGCPGCASSMPVFDAITMFSSHELCEAITDPIPGEGWYSDVQNQNEIGDLCNQQPKLIGQYTVQKIWSNRSGACL